MKRPHLLVRLVVVGLLASLLAPPALHAQRRTTTATIAPLKTATPQSVGFAQDLPARMDQAMQGLIDSKHLANHEDLQRRVVYEALGSAK